MIRFSLKEVMSDKKVSIQELSDNTGLSRTTISNISNNLAQGIQLDTLDKILKYLEVSVTEIIEFQSDYSFNIDTVSIDYEMNTIFSKFNFKNHIDMQDASIPFYVNFEHINRMTHFYFFNEQTKDNDITFIMAAILKQGYDTPIQPIPDFLEMKLTDDLENLDKENPESLLSLLENVTSIKKLINDLFETFNFKFALSFSDKIKDDYNSGNSFALNWNSNNRTIDLAYSFSWDVMPEGLPLSDQSLTNVLTYEDIMNYAQNAIQN
ncbi:helix-turn-helix domain-containing protein [Candidatus Enterococcus courvalinii]|uniref:Helix-turn-helix transcriptional regulator n=1 Tax=Candidatus Enterococcus courvalinii TaxID=2815329 RepID=A0ABS3HZB6_9ENTE|nr:helix-turn-helix transcriptional regulator [Enterococcus sp. MSG2901]MBO0481803.1 helix-turn-helix transcriptional regulator [Enterococcus sp. MSG2901]